MVIKHNISSLNANNQLSKNLKTTQSSLTKLSSGLRINSSADDAAGLTISQKMHAIINGLDQASRNAQDGISLIQTAEGSLSETQSILQRMNTLAVQAANGTYTDNDRDQIQLEVDQLAQEITHISNDSNFNEQKLLNGGISDNGIHSLSLQIGASTGQMMSLSIDAMDAKTLGVSRDIASTSGASSITTTTGAVTSGNNIASSSFSSTTGSGVADGKTLTFTYIPPNNGTKANLNSSFAPLLATSQANAETGTDDVTVTVYGDAYTLTGAQLKAGWGDGVTTGTYTNHTSAELAAMLGTATNSSGDTLASVVDINYSFGIDIVAKTAVAGTLTYAAKGSSVDLFFIGANTATGTDPVPAQLSIATLVSPGTVASATAQNAADVTSSVSNVMGDVNVSFGGMFFTLYGSDIIFDKDTQDVNDLAALLGTATDFNGNSLSQFADITESGGKLTIASKSIHDYGVDVFIMDFSNTVEPLFGFSNMNNTLGGAPDTVTNSQTISLSNDSASSFTVSSGTYAGTTITMKSGKTLADISRFTDEQVDVTQTTTTTPGIPTSDGISSAAQFSNNTLTADATCSAGIDVSTQPAASSAIATISKAIETISKQRSKLGAYQNRLDHIINNLSTSSENLTSAVSHITDVDMAKEMMIFSKSNILTQCSQAMLAQANQQPQGVLSLLS